MVQGKEESTDYADRPLHFGPKAPAASLECFRDLARHPQLRRKLGRAQRQMAEVSFRSDLTRR